MTVIKGNISKISEVFTYPATADRPEAIVVWVTVIENHQRRNEDGDYEDIGSTTYEVRFAGSMAVRVVRSFDKGNPVLIETRGELRAETFVTRTGEVLPTIKAMGTDIGLSCRYRAFLDMIPAEEVADAA